MEKEEVMTDEEVRMRNIEVGLQVALSVWAKSQGLNDEGYVRFFVRDAMEYLRASMSSTMTAEKNKNDP